MLARAPFDSGPANSGLREPLDHGHPPGAGSLVQLGVAGQS